MPKFHAVFEGPMICEHGHHNVHTIYTGPEPEDRRLCFPRAYTREKEIDADDLAAAVYAAGDMILADEYVRVEIEIEE